MSKQNSNALDANLAARIDALADECAHAQAMADDATEKAREHLRDVVASGDLADSKVSNRFQRRFIATLSGEPVPDGPLSGKDSVLSARQTTVYATVRKWLSRARAEAGIETVRKDGEAKETGKKATAKGADQKADQSGREQRVPTQQAAWDALQMAAYQIADARTRAACQKSLQNVAEKLGLETGE